MPTLRTLALGSGLLFATVALAGDKVTVTNPLGATMEAEKITAPAEGSPEHAVVTSMQMLIDGEFDQWISTWCHPSFCPDDAGAIEGLKNYNLKAAQKSAPSCLHDGAILVTRRDGDPAADTTVKIFTFCGENRMPAPATLEKVGDAWKVSSLSW